MVKKFDSNLPLLNSLFILICMNKATLLIPVLLSLFLSSCIKAEINDSNQVNDINNLENQKIKKGETMSNQIPENEKGLILKDQVITMKTNFGDLNIKMLDEIAPKTTENFIRLSFRNYFDNIIFHRIVKGEGFSIIQGGDPTASGAGGQSAWGEEFEDELEDENGDLPEAYADYNGRYAVYKKGLVAMANAGPNTNGSQFFIMLDDTNLPPAYTIFGQIDEADFPVLDKISREVDTDSPSGDGMPNKEIKILGTQLYE